MQYNNSSRKEQARKETTQKAISQLLKKGKKKGMLTYAEINDVLPSYMLSDEQIDETLMMFDDADIELAFTENAFVSGVVGKVQRVLTLGDGFHE